MPDDEKQQKESGQIVQQTAHALLDGILAFGDGMLRLGETVESLGVALAQKLLPINALKIVPARRMPTSD